MSANLTELAEKVKGYFPDQHLLKTIYLKKTDDAMIKKIIELEVSQFTAKNGGYVYTNIVVDSKGPGRITYKLTFTHASNLLAHAAVSR